MNEIKTEIIFYRLNATIFLLFVCYANISPTTKLFRWLLTFNRSEVVYIIKIYQKISYFDPDNIFEPLQVCNYIVTTSDASERAITYTIFVQKILIITVSAANKSIHIIIISAKCK